MLISLWESVSATILQFGIWGIVFILLLTFFHPTFEAPAAILLLTLLSVLLQSVWWATLLMLIAFTLGFLWFYWLVHALHKRSGFALNRFKLSQAALAWVKAQPTWKHILVIGMPLIYTYPLRVAFTLNHHNLKDYALQTFAQYVVLSLGNLVLYFGLIQIIFLNAPWWVPSLVLTGFGILIYLIRKKQPII
ncbi:MAG: hypothetical protein ACO3BB_03890 [Bacilli bacterium]